MVKGCARAGPVYAHPLVLGFVTIIWAQWVAIPVTLEVCLLRTSAGPSPGGGVDVALSDAVADSLVVSVRARVEVCSKGRGVVLRDNRK